MSYICMNPYHFLERGNSRGEPKIRDPYIVGMMCLHEKGIFYPIKENPEFKNNWFIVGLLHNVGDARRLHIAIRGEEWLPVSLETRGSRVYYTASGITTWMKDMDDFRVGLNMADYKLICEAITRYVEKEFN